MQSVSQLATVYGPNESQTIVENFATQVFFPGLPLGVTQDLEQILGNREIQERTIPLKSSAELRTMKNNIAIIGNHRPILLDSKAWYQDSRLKKLGSLPPPLIEAGAVNGKVEYIQLN